VLHLDIDGRWEPRDFIETLQAIESLYYLALAGEERALWKVIDYRSFSRFNWRSSTFDNYLDQANLWMLEHARRVLPDSDRVYVRRVEFASPGGMDVAGLGQALDAVDRLVGRLISFFTERHLRREWDEQASIETDMKRQTLLALKIENAQKLLELRREFPDDEHLIALAVRDQDKLAERIAQGQITGTGKKKG